MRRIAFFLVLVFAAPMAFGQGETKMPDPPSPELIAKAKECREASRKEPYLRGIMMSELTIDLHEQDAKKMMKNKRHVVAAYAALWMLAVGFLALLFFRQRSLLAEIARLKAEVAVAVADDEQE